MYLQRAAVVTTCGWCGTRIAPKPRGRLPTWCSSTCRHRAWEQRRAAASGRSAVEVVDRRVEVFVPPPTPPSHEVPVGPSGTPLPAAPIPSSPPPSRSERSAPAPTPPSRRDWPGVLEELRRQLDDGRVYDRDLIALVQALNGVLEATQSRWSIADPRYRQARRG